MQLTSMQELKICLISLSVQYSPLLSSPNSQQPIFQANMKFQQRFTDEADVLLRRR